MGDVHGADNQDRSVPACFGNAGNAVRAVGDQRPSTGRRPAAWTPVASVHDPKDRSVPDRTRRLKRLDAARSEDAGKALCRALAADAARLGLSISADVRGEQDWCSATFTGTRLTVRIEALPHPAWADVFATWLAALPDRDLPMARHLVADLIAEPGIATDAGVNIYLEALLLDRPPSGT